MTEKRKIKPGDVFCPFVSKTIIERVRKKWNKAEKIKGALLTKDEYIDLAFLEQRKAMQECISRKKT